jgi:two-component system cell cycle sensor histidine kinase/response regulator CckA
MSTVPGEDPLRNRIESIYRANPAGMGIVVNRTLVEVNEKLCEMTGYSKEELVGRNSRFLYVSDQEYERIGATGFPRLETIGLVTQETSWKRKGGTVFDVLISSSPLDLNDPSAGITFTALDITEHKRAEQAQRRTEERFRLLFRSISDAVLVHPFHEDGSPEVFVEVNEAACRRLGYSREELLKMSPLDIDAPEGLARIPEAMRRLKAEGFSKWEGVHVTRGGRKIPVEISNTLFEMDGQPMILATIRDISERKNAEKAFREHEETLHALLNATTDLAFLVASSGQLLACNEAFARTVGSQSFDQIGPGPIWEMKTLPLDERAREQTAKVLRTGLPARLEVSRDSSVFDLGIFPIPDESGDIHRLAFFLRDITSSRHTEDQLRQAQKMEAVGRLAGGIAHDFNNLVTVIRGFSELALAELPADSRMAADIAQVKSAADRAAELTSRLLTFSRKQVLLPRVVDIVSLVSGIEAMLRRVIGEDVDVTTDLSADTGRVMADPGQIEQVLMNLAVNARDAMPRGGSLRIQASNHAASGYGGAEFPGLDAGEYVRLQVSDTGHGMDRETLTRIFEPFFTTKGPGKGTGMGLSTVYGIVSQSGGRIYCTSAPEEGTVFTIFFPRLLGPVRDAAPAAPAARSPGGTERVLLVEDESAVRGYARRVLEKGGYTVLEAPSGERAMEIAARDPGSIHLLLTDVVMPGMGGSELASRLASLRPSVRTLFISGYTQQALESRGTLSGEARLLRKPFDEGALLAAVRDVLR